MTISWSVREPGRHTFLAAAFCHTTFRGFVSWRHDCLPLARTVMSDHVHVTLVLEQAVRGAAKEIKVTLRWLEASSKELKTIHASQKATRSSVRSFLAYIDTSNFSALGGWSPAVADGCRIAFIVHLSSVKTRDISAISVSPDSRSPPSVLRSIQSELEVGTPTIIDEMRPCFRVGGAWERC